MKGKLIWAIFWALVIILAIEVVTIFTWAVNDYTLFGGMGIVFLLGIALIFITLKRKIQGKLKGFLLLTGASIVGIPVFVVMHNLVYGLFINMFGSDFWGAGGDEPVFFILAIIVCPLAFLVGAAGTIILNYKSKYTSPKGIS